ncbi:MAG: hypothetical protein IKH05_11790 [Bacteroidaceae bacterium]|nr:hypothetical protein [Bacteroidaceae bacterium]
MTDAEELKHVLEVLKRFDLPISPILEYAIKEKIEELSLNRERSASVPVAEVFSEENFFESSSIKAVTAKKKPTSLRVTRANGTTIECVKAADTLCQSIQEIGVEKVYLLNIPMDGMHLVTIGGNPQYPSAQHDVGGGFFVNVHSNTATKKRQLERICQALGIDWRIEIIGNN